MTELSGFSAAQPVAALPPQALQLPSSIEEVCDCESGCGASRILKGLTQVVGSHLTNVIHVDIQCLQDEGPNQGKVQVVLRPMSIDGVQQNGVVNPGGWLVIDGTRVVGMSQQDYCAWAGIPYEAPQPEPAPAPEPEPEPEPGDAPAA